MRYIGIDISKDSFTVAFSSVKGSKTQSYKNTPKDIQKFIKTLDKEQDHCVMEATGNYTFKLLYLLIEQGYKASLVNPKQTKYFAKTMLSVTKTDPQDACLLACYGEKMTPPVYKMPSEKIILLKQKRTVIRQLRKQLTALKNLEKSLEVLPRKDKNAFTCLNNTISYTEKQTEKLEKELIDDITEDFDKQLDLLTSIKGIGDKLAASLIIVTGGFSFFENPKQISRFLGICPTYQQSGSSINIKGSINRNGDSYLRGMLFLASLAAIRFNTACKELFSNFKAKGKPVKVALIAVANKLIRQAFAVVKSGISYIDGYISKPPITTVKIISN